jgi:NAD(P)-dependent dehydrogenase (short-subunit alcohol dehydrogenase family)
MSRVVLVTGGSSGIGREAAIALAARGDTVIVAARDRQRGEAAAVQIRSRAGNGEVHFAPLDLASFDSILRCAEDVLNRFDRLDALLNNAGAVLSDRRLTAEGYEQTFGANHLGHFLLTRLLLERLKASGRARVVTVSSMAHRFLLKMPFDDLQSERSYSAMRAYAVSKLANVLFSAELARRLEGSGVSSNSLEPGLVRTGFARDGDTRGLLRLVAAAGKFLYSTPAVGARTLVYLATAPELEGVSGRHFVDCRPRRVGLGARSAHSARRLWEISESLVAPALAAQAPPCASARISPEDIAKPCAEEK